MPADLSFLPDFQRARLTDFRRDVRAGRAAVLIGAGVSRRAGMADGWTLASRLAEGRGVPSAVTGDLIAVCNHLDSVYGAPWLRRELAQMLDDERIPLSDAHQLLARIPFSSYYTTNVDRLMEWALADAGRPHSTLFLDPDAALLPMGKCPVVKLHGTIDHPHTMVFTSGDFDRFSGLMERLLFQAATATNLLIVGYRGTDPNFLRMLTLVRQHFGGCSPILIDFGREAERQALLDQGMFLVDPGPGQYDRLVDVLAWIGDLDDDVVEVCRRRHGRVARANPFPGLAPYGVGASNFHGREDVVRTLADRLDSLGPITVFFGDSGCGKTSLFQAGLLPELERRGIPWAQVGSDPGGDPGTRLAEAVWARLGAKPGQSLRVCLSSLRREGRRIVVVIDQFERALVPEPSAAAERFLATTLPELAGEFGNALRVLIVLRSDALYQLHPYRDRPGLEGVYMAAERLETLDRAAALVLVNEVFLAKGYRLAPKAATALVARTASAQGAVYLPYLQLLCRTLFDRLDETHGAQRGLGTVVPVTMRAITSLDSADVILRHVRDAALALARIEPDRATVLKLFDLLTERHRRTVLRRDRLAEEFVEPARVIALLHDLANRRVVHFDEILEGYELVHDSLIEPMRDFLDQERTDFSHGDLLALARRLFEGDALPPAALSNLARHCLRRGLSPAWLERVSQPVGGWLDFWTEARLSCREDERLRVWERIARSAKRESRSPAIMPVEALAQLLTTRDPRMALAVLQVLATLKLAAKDIDTLWRWLDPDHAEMAETSVAALALYSGGAVAEDEELLRRLDLPGDRIAALDTLPLRRGWGEVVDAALDILFADRRVDPTALFAGYHAEIYSETVWWEPYLRRLAALPSRHRAAGKAAKRLEDVAVQAGGDPERLVALARALLAAPDPVGRWSGILQRLADSLAKRSRRLGFDLFLPVAELLLEAAPKFVFIKTKTLFPDLVRAGQERRAARLLGLAAQEPEDLGELIFRADTSRSDPEIQCWLTHAAVESPAEVGREEYEGGILLDVVEDCHRPSWGSACAAILTGDSWAAEGLAQFEQWSDRDLLVRVYALALLDWGLSERDLWLLRSRAWRLLCAVALRRAEDDIDCIRHDPLTAGWSEVADSWDQVAQEVGTRGPPLLQVAEELEGQLRWLRHVTAGVNLEDIGVPRVLMTQWFTDYEALPHRLQGIWPSTCRPLVARSQAFEDLMDSTETNDPEVSLPAMVDRLGLSDRVKVNDLVAAMRIYREAEDCAQSRMVLQVAEELVVMMVAQLEQEPQPGAEGFLWAILNRSSWIGLPGLAEHEVESLTMQALLRAYRGAEPHLLESLAHDVKEPAWQLRALLHVAEGHPTLASGQLADAIDSVVADGDDSPDVCRAIRLLAHGESAPPILDLLRRLVPHRNEQVAAAACRSLFTLSAAAQDHLLVLEQALHRPALSESLEFPIGQH